MMKNRLQARVGPNRPAQGPRGLPIVGVLPKLLADPLTFFTSTAATYGGLVRLNVGPRVLHLVTEPAYVKQILQDRQKKYIRGPAIELARGLFGQGLATSDGPAWLKQRRLMQPAFHRSRLESLFGVMVAETTAWLDEVEATDGEMDVHAAMMRVTQRIIVRSMFSGSIAEQSERVAKALEIAERYIGDHSFALVNLPLWVPTAQNRRYRWALAELDRIILDIIDARRKDGEAHDDLLTMLLSATDADTGEAMSDRQLRDEVVTIFIAGHETTANGLTWALHLLSTHEASMTALRKEIDDVMRDGFTIERAMRLPYCRAVMEETLRLFPPAWIFARTSIEPDTFDDVELSRGSTFLLSPYVTHRREDLWPDAPAFVPERFLADQNLARSKFHYYPFGGGPHLCIGQHFALLESTVVLTLLASRFDFSALVHDVKPRSGITLRTDGPLSMRLKRRERRGGRHLLHA